MNQAVVDFYFLILVHERLGDIGIVPVLDRRTTDEGRPIRNRFFFRGGGKIFACRKNRRGCANGAHGRHVNVLRGDGDERARRARVGVDECVSRNFCLVERVHDISRCIEPATVCVHVENDRGSFVALGRFHRAAQKRQERRRDFAVQRDHNDVAFMNNLTSVGGDGEEQS